MIKLELTKAQEEELCKELLSNPEQRNRTRCLIIYLRAKGHSRQEVANLTKVDEDTVTNLIKQYIEGGLSKLLENNYRKPNSQLEPHTEELTELFKKKAASNSESSNRND